MVDYKKWITSGSKYIVNDRWLKLRADTCITPDGHTLDPFYVLEFPDWINCLVIDDAGDAIMIRQYRHGAKDYVLEVVGGSKDPQDITSEDAIRRELKEELGYVGGKVVQTGTCYANPANQTNKIYSYLAFGGTTSQEQELEPGENIHIEKIPFIKIVEMMNSSGENEIFQSYNITNIFFALNYIKSSNDDQLSKLRNLLS